MRILMVCLGNICRSPLAEGILKEKVKARKLNWTVDSAGTSGWHDGAQPDERSIAIASHHNIDITDQRSRKITPEDFEKFDLILAMDSSNYQNILKISPSIPDKDKVELILNYSDPGQNRAVPDPYYNNGFHEVYEMLEKACIALIDTYSVKEN